MLLYLSGRCEHFPVKLQKGNIMKKLTIKDIAKKAGACAAGVLTGWRGNIFKTLSEKDIRWE